MSSSQPRGWITGRRAAAVIAATGVIALALAACASPTTTPTESTAATADAGDLTLAVPITFGTFSPQESGDGYNVQLFQAVYDTLVLEEPDGSYSGYLAESWEYDETETELTLHLADGVAFDDGTPLDAAAVKANLEATRDGTSAYASSIASIEEVEAVDDTTAVIHLAHPDLGLIRALSQPAGAIANPAKIGTGELTTTPDGTGPYTLNTTDSVTGSSLVFEKRDDYWNTDLHVPYSTLTFLSLADDTARLNAVQSGQIDATFLTPASLPQAETAGLTITPYTAPGLASLFIWDRDGQVIPALGDVRVRQALNHAIDKDALLASARDGLGEVTGQLWREGWEGYDADLDDAYDYDPERARELLAEAGYADGFELPLLQWGTEFDFVSQYLADIGITVVPVATTNSADFRSGSTPAILFQLASSAPWQVVTSIITPDAAWNPLHTSTPDLDELIATAQNNVGEERTEAIAGINQYVTENAWFVPLYYTVSNYVSTPEVVVTPQYLNVPSIYNFAPAE
jgi:peptide/nickel transport system substrate-binding protein